LYGVSEDGTYSEWLAARKQSLCLIPDGVDDVNSAGIPVAYLTAQLALSLAGFQAGKTVLAPAIGGSIGNAVTHWLVLWRETRHLQYHESQESRAGEGPRIR
jgi:NADPH:quinone reductase